MRVDLCKKLHVKRVKWNVMVDFHEDSNLISTDFAVRYSKVNKSDAKKNINNTNSWVDDHKVSNFRTLKLRHLL